MVRKRMLKIARFHGGRTNTEGACPGCGRTVPRTHAWTSAQARDAYDCPTCGTFEYATQGEVQLPTRPTAQLTTVLDPIDCVS